MARPPSHREYPLPEKRCGNCKHCILLYYRNDYVCFHGEDVERMDEQDYPNKSYIVALKDGEVLNWENKWKDNSHYDKVWGRGAVDINWEVCDCWEQS